MKTGLMHFFLAACALFATSLAMAQLPRPIANPNLDLRQVSTPRDVLPLGDGSFIMSGDFSFVADSPRQQIVKVLSNGSVDTNWNVSVNGIVWQLIRDGDRLLLIGQFSTVNGVARRGLAAVSIGTGQLEAWDPNLGSTSTYRFVGGVKVGNALYVGGEFSQLGTQTRTRLAKVDATTGVLDPTWLASANVTVNSVTSDGSNIFLGGDFTQVNSTARNYAAKLDLINGTLDSWAPNFSASVIDQVVDGGQFYAVGCFSAINGTPRNFLARVDTSTGVLDSTWNPQPGAGCTVGVDVTATHVYAGGPFSARISRFSKTGTGQLDAAFAPQFGGGVFGYGSREISATAVLVWGEFVTVAGGYTPGSAIVERSSGAVLTALGSETRGYVNAVLPTADGGTLLGGSFSRVRNVSPTTPRQGLVKLTASGALDSSFTTHADGVVNALVSNATHIYVGGSFARLGSQTTQRLARMTTSFVADAAWAPQPSAQVLALAIDPSTQSVYCGGSFGFIGGQVRTNVAQIRQSDALASSWTVALNGTVHAIALDSGNAYLGGEFTTVAGQAKQRLAKVSASTGALDTGFSADANSTVRSILPGPSNTLYVGGFFNVISGLGRPAFVKLLSATGAPDPSWNTFLSSGSVFAIAPAASGIYVGGSFNSIDGQARSNLVRVSHSGQIEPLFAPSFDQSLLAVVEQGSRVIAGGFFNFGSVGNNFIGVQAFPLTATPVSTVTTITDDSPEISQVNQSFRVSLNVSSAEGPPLQNSQVIVNDDRGNTCTVFLDVSGAGICDLGGNRDAGTRILTANFVGTPLFLPSSDTETHTITGNSGTPPVNTAVELRSIVTPSASVRLSDGSVVIAGTFSRVGGLARRGLAKLLADGTPDPSFQSNLVGSVYSLTRDSQDNIFVAGNFGYIGSTLRRNLAKITANGSVVAGWQAGQTCISTAGRLVVDGADDFYVVGCSQFISGTPSRYDTRIFKLSGANGATLVNELVIASQPSTSFPSFNLDINSNQLYISGSYAAIAGTSRSNLARFSLTGNLDTSFNPGIINQRVSVLEFASNGAVYLGGDFTQIAGQTVARLAKLDSTGALDTNFAANPNSGVVGLILEGTNLYASGTFTSIGGVTRSCAAKLDPATGTADPSFNVTEFTCTFLRKLGSDLLVGHFNYLFQGQQRMGIARLEANTGSNLPVELVSRAAQVRALARQPDGATLVGGVFARVGTTHQNLIRITPAGLFDNTFNPRPNGVVNDLYVDGSSNIFVAGSFNQVAGTGRTGIAKLQSSGALDANFNVGSLGTVNKLLPLTDALVIGGSFSQANGLVRNGVAKVDFATGAVDATWIPNPSTSAQIRTLSKDASENVYIGGSFSTVGGLARQNLAKVSSTGAGSVDSAWIANTNSTVLSLLVDGNDLFVGGSFSQLVGQSRFGLGKVSVAAPVALASFNPANNETTIQNYALAKALDGNLLIGGNFIRAGGQFRSFAAKLDPISGAADPLWNPSFDNIVFALLPGYGNTPVVNRNAFVEQNVAFGGDFEFIGGVEMPGFSATSDATTAPLSERIFCSRFEDTACSPLP